MPRIPRGLIGGQIYHVINRGNGRAVVFHKDGDYLAFIELLAKATRKFPVDLFGFCLMPNHFHLVLQPQTDDTLSSFMQWWLTSHVRRYHRHYESSGHVWQGRFKSFPIQLDGHFLTVLRYVLRNPVRANLVHHPADWRWSSLQHHTLMAPLPVPLPVNWEDWLAQPLVDHELMRLRECVNRQAPYGAPEWQQHLATTLGLESTLRRRGRPPKSSPEK